MSEGTTIRSSKETCFVQSECLLDKLKTAILSQPSEIGHLVLKLEELYKMSDEVTCYNIIEGLSEQRCEAGLPLIRHALDEGRSGLVRHEAAFGLGFLSNDQDDRDSLVGALKDPVPMVRHEAAVALADIGDETSLTALKNLVADEDPDVALSARYAIQSIISRSGNTR